jgi:hypothetical protein
MSTLSNIISTFLWNNCRTSFPTSRKVDPRVVIPQTVWTLTARCLLQYSEMQSVGWIYNVRRTSNKELWSIKAQRESSTFLRSIFRRHAVCTWPRPRSFLAPLLSLPRKVPEPDTMVLEHSKTSDGAPRDAFHKSAKVGRNLAFLPGESTLANHSHWATTAARLWIEMANWTIRSTTQYQYEQDFLFREEKFAGSFMPLKWPETSNLAQLG